MSKSIQRRLYCAAISIAAFASFSIVSAQEGIDEYDEAPEQSVYPPAEGPSPAPSPAIPPAPSPAVSTAAEASGSIDGEGDAGAEGTELADTDKAKPDAKDAAKPGAEGGAAPLFAKPEFELSVGMATVDGEPWSRIALGVDLPIWKFGVFLDIELFIDNDSKLSNKGWDFENNAAEAILRKIRYIRYGHENEPLFVKFGGLSNVTLGYGMILDRFTNMLRYPDEKLLGLQFYLNDVSPVGVSLQTMISDFAEMKDDGGVYAARLAVRPLKQSGIFLADGLTVGGMFAMDANVLAPARKWGVNKEDQILKEIRDSTDFFDEYKNIYEKHTGLSADAILEKLDAEDSLRKSTRSFSLYGFDAGLPIISTDLLSVELYGQSAFRADTVSGWGIGAPGVAAKLWKLWANLEYRKIEGRFTPGYFDAYYLDERYSRGQLLSKDQLIDSVSLSGVFGRVGMDVFGAITVDGSYQYMAGEDGYKSQGYEATAGIGEAIMSRIPKFNTAEIYIRNANVGIYDKYDKKGNLIVSDAAVFPPETYKAGLFDRSPGMYWGYRLGFEIAAGASLIWDYRYGWKIENEKLVPDNHMILQTALRF
ncbi:MAG: hypothetical protein LBH93_02415 [Chitinispirillales bacterium]|jgi:hypothetical protein|nr:hypothetical protein [Chitinispirillales bacterium]